MRPSTADFLKQARQRAIQEKRVQLQRELKFAQDTHAAQLNQQLKTLGYLEEHPNAAPPSAVSNLLGEMREEIDYTVAHFAMKQGYHVDNISESMKSEIYDREYAAHPESVDAVVTRAQTAQHHKQQFAQAEL
jgi:hypothetical protein